MKVKYGKVLLILVLTSLLAACQPNLLEKEISNKEWVVEWPEEMSDLQKGDKLKLLIDKGKVQSYSVTQATGEEQVHKVLAHKGTEYFETGDRIAAVEFYFKDKHECVHKASLGFLLKGFRTSTPTEMETPIFAFDIKDIGGKCPHRFGHGKGGGVGG